MSKRKLKILTIAEKVNVINMVERSGKKNYEVANAFGIPSSTLSTILKNKTKILTNFKLQPGRKKMKLAEFPNLDASLFKWYVQCKDSNQPVSGPILKEKAYILAKSLGYSNFKNSTGWLDKWKKRNNITLRKPATCSSGRVSVIAGNERLAGAVQRKSDILTAVVSEYSPNDIFNAAETGIFFRCLPDSGQQLCCGGGDDCHDGGRSKDRVTVLLCTNMSGTEKLKPLVIGKSARPRCFDGIKSLPIDYESNPKAWMTPLLWNKWLKRFDEKMFLENRKIVLFIDKCTAHVVASSLKAITVRFLPIDDASKLLQPLHNGIIQYFKVFYRKEVIRKITSHIELQRAISIDLLQAARITDKSWRLITTEIISNGFKKAGFSHPGTLVQTTSSYQEPYDEKNNPEWSYIIQHYNLMSEFTFNNFVQIDKNLKICSNFNESEIVSEATELTSYISDNDKNNCSISKKVTYKEATKAFDILRDFIETTEGMENIHFKALGTIEDVIDKIKQTETQKKKKCGADYVLMELDENTNPFTCEDINSFHKLAQDNGAVFTTKSLMNSIRQISPIQQFKDITNDEDEISSDLQLAFPPIPEKDISEDRKSYETVDLVEKIQQKFPKHELQFWEFQEISTCLPEVVVAIGIKAISCKFTLDDKSLGYDHAMSICARDFRTMVTNIRAVEDALGTGKKDKLSPSEIPCFKKLFKSVVAAKNLERGSTLKAEDMKIKVSDTQSMSGFYFPVVIGRKLLSEVDEDDPIFVSDFEGLKHYTHYMPYDAPVPEYTGYITEIDLGRSIHVKSPCYIIAEIGQNHQGDIMMAKKLIKLAKKCGADCVKFQKTCINEKFTSLARNRLYTSKNSFGKTYGEHKRFLEFTEDQYKELRRYAVKKVGIHFTASAMDPVSFDFIVGLKVPFVKIGSGESGNVMLLEKAAKAYVPLVISTGMQTLADIRITYETVSRYHNYFALLHCVSAYPTPPEEANLNMIKTLRKCFPSTIIGYSGHEVGSSLTAASVALGAKIIERHITLDRNMKGSDHICSLDPSQFSKLVRDIRYIESNLAI